MHHNEPMRSAPPSVHAVAKPVLAPLKKHLRRTFAMRLDRWWPDLDAAIRAVYPSDQADALTVRLVTLAAQAYVDRDPELRHLDEARTLEPDWFQSPQMLGLRRLHRAVRR